MVFHESEVSKGKYQHRSSKDACCGRQHVTLLFGLILHAKVVVKSLFEGKVLSLQLYLHCCEECLHKSKKVFVKCLAVLQPSCTVVFRKREVGNLRSNGQPNYQTETVRQLYVNIALA